MLWLEESEWGGEEGRRQGKEAEGWQQTLELREREKEKKKYSDKEEWKRKKENKELRWQKTILPF